MISSPKLQFCAPAKYATLESPPKSPSPLRVKTCPLPKFPAPKVLTGKLSGTEGCSNHSLSMFSGSAAIMKVSSVQDKNKSTEMFDNNLKDRTRVVLHGGELGQLQRCSINVVIIIIQQTCMETAPLRYPYSTRTPSACVSYPFSLSERTGCNGIGTTIWWLVAFPKVGAFMSLGTGKSRGGDFYP